MENLRDCWATPEYIVRGAEKVLCVEFDLDVAASAGNAKAPSFYTFADNGLARPWHGDVWCNPPYSQIESWVDKAIVSAARDCSSVTMLLPVRSDLSWWADLVEYGVTMHFYRGRIAFVPPEGVKASAPFERSALIYVSSKNKYTDVYCTLNAKDGNPL